MFFLGKSEKDEKDELSCKKVLRVLGVNLRTHFTGGAEAQTGRRTERWTGSKETGLGAARRKRIEVNEAGCTKEMRCFR